MVELAVFVGIPGSGKSTFYEQNLAGTHALVSLDLMGRSSPKGPRMMRRIREVLSEGRNVAVDNTNVDLESRAALLAVAREVGAKVHCYFFPPDVGECLRRNEARQGKKKIPVAGVWYKYDHLVIPSFDEGFDVMTDVRAVDGGFRLTSRFRVSPT